MIGLPQPSRIKPVIWSTWLAGMRALQELEKKEDAAACQRSANHAPARANELSVRVKKGTKGRLLVTLRLRHRILGIGVASILLIPALVSAQDAKKGAAEFKTAGCNGCHKINGEPANATMGPDLSHEGKTRKAADIRKKMEDARKPVLTQIQLRTRHEDVPGYNPLV